MPDYEIQFFIRFLKEHNAYTKYCFEREKYLKERNSFLLYARSKKHIGLLFTNIDIAFEWLGTTDGVEFWFNLDREYNVIKKQLLKKTQGT